MKEFTTALAQQAEDGVAEELKAWPFTLDGKEYKIFQPTPEQFAVFVASTGRHSSEREQIAGVVDLFFNMLDGPSHGRLYERLTDRSDPFDAGKIEEIIYWLIEQWSGKDSESASVSTSSQPSPGTTSSPPTPVST